jgi:hypothetical protein
MINDTLLLSGKDIPFIEAQVTVHPPTIEEIGYIGDEAFLVGCELLNFSKNVLSVQDKINLESQSNFEVFMSIMKDKRTPAIQKNRASALMVLTLIFPDYGIGIGQDKISLNKEGEEPHFIDSKNYEKFQEILVAMFCLKDQKSNPDNYNPQGDRARQIAEKLQKGRQKVAEAKGEQKKINIFNRYVSILAVGEHKDINELMKYTVYQLYDELERFELNEAFKLYVQQKLAGAKDVEEVDNWMKDIHP